MERVGVDTATSKLDLPGATTGDRRQTRFAEIVLCLSFVTLLSIVSITSLFHLTRLQNQVDILEQRLNDDRTQWESFAESIIQKVGCS